MFLKSIGRDVHRVKISRIGIRSWKAWNPQRVRLYEPQICFKSPRKPVNRVTAMRTLTGMRDRERVCTIYMIQQQSDSFANSAHSSTPSFSTSSWCSRPRVQGKGPRKQDGGRREKPQSSRERRSLDSRVRIYRRGSRANARDVLRPLYVRKLKS